MDDFSVAEESEFHIVRTKRFSVKPMSPEEAILQMNLLDHDFYVFRNSDDDSISIVYHRKNGGYGLIVTDGRIKYKQGASGALFQRAEKVFSPR